MNDNRLPLFWLKPNKYQMYERKNVLYTKLYDLLNVIISKFYVKLPGKNEVFLKVKQTKLWYKDLFYEQKFNIRDSYGHI